MTRAGSRLSRARPDELVIANVARRVLGLIRDEALEDRSDPNGTGPATGTQTPLATPLGASVLTPQPVSSSSNDSPLASAAAAAAAASTDPARRIHALRSEVIDGIEEILDEISQVDDQVGAQADVHIRPGDHVLLHQPSATVQRFILRAAARRKFSVLIDTRAPTRDGRPNDQESTTSASGQQHPYASFRKKLSAAGIPAVNISAGSAMAYMSRVDKVIMGASAIAASGGIVTDAGASVLARAAHACGTTVVVLAGIYKLSPVDPASHDDVIEWANPITFVDFGDAALVHGVTVRAALKEFVPHELIDTYITNL